MCSLRDCLAQQRKGPELARQHTDSLLEIVRRIGASSPASVSSIATTQAQEPQVLPQEIVDTESNDLHSCHKFCLRPITFIFEELHLLIAERMRRKFSLLSSEIKSDKEDNGGIWRI
jgi:hypothetical protein